jgi:hypothetical protein
MNNCHIKVNDCKVTAIDGTYFTNTFLEAEAIFAGNINLQEGKSKL